MILFGEILLSQKKFEQILEFMNAWNSVTLFLLQILHLNRKMLIQPGTEVFKWLRAEDNEQHAYYLELRESSSKVVNEKQEFYWNHWLTYTEVTLNKVELSKVFAIVWDCLEMDTSETLLQARCGDIMKP